MNMYETYIYKGRKHISSETMNIDSSVKYILIGGVLFLLWIICGVAVMIGTGDILKAYPNNTGYEVNGILLSYLLLTVLAIEYFKRPVFTGTKIPGKR